MAVQYLDDKVVSDRLGELSMTERSMYDVFCTAAEKGYELDGAIGARRVVRRVHLGYTGVDFNRENLLQEVAISVVVAQKEAELKKKREDFGY